MSEELSIKLIEGETLPEVWLKAVRFLSKQQGREFFDLVLHVKNPTVANVADKSTIQKVESFLRKHKGMPVSTVAETIFPMSYYKRGGKDAVYNDYVRDILEIRDGRDNEHNGWGLYALRMINFTLPSGKTFNQLEKVIEKVGFKVKYQNCFEVNAS